MVEAAVFLIVFTLVALFFTVLAILSDVVLRYTCNKSLFPKDYFK
jgi:hypothetical protein